MKKAIFTLILGAISSSTYGYQGLITLNHATKRGGKTTTQVIDEYKQDNAVVFFSKSSCPYCTTLKPRFRTLANNNINRAQFIVINVGNSTTYKSRYGFSTYPHVAYYKNGQKRSCHGSNNGRMTTGQMQSYMNSIY